MTTLDIFRLNSAKDSDKGAQRDIIHDFEDVDVIDLAKIDANIKKAGDQKFNFIGDDLFGHKRGELRFDSSILSGDVDGDGKPDFQVLVIGAAVTGTIWFCRRDPSIEPWHAWPLDRPHQHVPLLAERQFDRAFLSEVFERE